MMQSTSYGQIGRLLERDTRLDASVCQKTDKCEEILFKNQMEGASTGDFFYIILMTNP